MTIMLNLNEIKKDLYKSKEMAKFSHYESGKLYYSLKIEDKMYQFPISTVDDETIETLVTKGYATVWKKEIVGIKLSEDLGNTTFSNEIKGSELIRWIGKSIDNETLRKLT